MMRHPRLCSRTGWRGVKRKQHPRTSIRVFVAIVAVAGLALASCAAVPKRVVRDTQTYTAEILAGLAREHAAAELLVDAAEQARTGGDEARCRTYYATAHLIDVKAQAQAYRALWLAVVPYPLPDGSLPAAEEEQGDPGPGGTIDDSIVAKFCMLDNAETEELEAP